MGALDELEYILDGKVIQSRFTSFLGLQAGDLVSFEYTDGSSRFGLVVRSKRTFRGYFLSTKDNTLLNIFLLDSITESMLKLILNNLYRNRIRCTYKNTPRILSVFIGEKNFRTFNTAKIHHLAKIEIV